MVKQAAKRSSLGDTIVLEKLRSYLRRHPKLGRTYRGLSWQKSRLDDWRDNVLGEPLREGTTPYGFKMRVRNHPANRAMLNGTFDPEEVAVIQKHLSQTDVFVDIGANIGFFTCIALHHGKRAVAVEPQPRNLRCLYANLVSNQWTDRAEVFPLGLSERPGIQELYGASGPSASLISNWAQYSNRFHQTIPLTTLDILLGSRFACKRLLIKIDVEGYEFPVLRGASATLALSPRPVWLLEICLNEYHPAGVNPNYQQTFELFWAAGYEARTADARNALVRREDVKEWCASKRSSSGAINYIFTEPTARK